MDGVDNGSNNGDPLAVENSDNPPSSISPSVSTVYVTIPQSNIVNTSKGVSTILSFSLLTFICPFNKLIFFQRA